MKKNELYEIEITGMTAEGQGVGRVEGMAVFVPGTAVGDRLQVRILKPLKNYAFGKIEELLVPADCRQTPDCPSAGKCGGCVYRHITYGEELRLKRQTVDDCLARIGGLSLCTDCIRFAEDSAGNPLVNGYRNKALIPLTRVEGKTKGGFYAVHSHRVIPSEVCSLSPEIFGVIQRIVLDYADRFAVSVYDEETGKGLLRHLYLRQGEGTGQVLVTLVVNGTALPESGWLVEALRAAVPGLCGVLLSVNREKTNVVLGKKFIPLWGEPCLEDILCGLRFRLAPAAFYQVNRRGAELLYGRAADFADPKPGELLLDLYCGAGTIGLSMASKAGKVIGVEVIPEAVENARENARRNGIENAEFFCGDASAAAERMRSEGLRPDIIVVDPPRKGCDEACLRACAEMGPSRIVYVSCDPATLARDLARLSAMGYSPERAEAVDMFPRTGHVETVVLMSRNRE